MKTALAVILFVVLVSVSTPVSAFAQDQSAIAAAEAACGPNDVEFRVTSDKTQHPAPLPEAGKAMVYVVEDQVYKFTRDVTTRVGLDGAWVGANRGNSYLFFSVGPGEHHLCSDWPNDILPGGRLVAVTSLTAEPGWVYYFRARTNGGRYTLPSFDLELVNSDEGKLMVASSAASTSQVKKPSGAK